MNAMMKIEIVDDDRQLENLTGLKATKIAFFRRGIEECAIQALHEQNIWK